MGINCCTAMHRMAKLATQVAPAWVNREIEKENRKRLKKKSVKERNLIQPEDYDPLLDDEEIIDKQIERVLASDEYKKILKKVPNAEAREIANIHWAIASLTDPNSQNI